MKTTFFDATGSQVDESIAVDERGVVKQGFSVRTSVLMIDGASDGNTLDALMATRNAMTCDAVDKYNERISNAWKSPQLLAVDRSPVEEPIVRDRAPDMATVYAIADRRLQNAWRY